MSLALIPIQTTMVTEHHPLFNGQGYSEKQNQQYAQVVYWRNWLTQLQG